jgi:hypothetical protein
MSEVHPKKLAAIVIGFTAVVGAAMYPIYFYPKQHITDYSKYHLDLMSHSHSLPFQCLRKDTGYHKERY